MSSINWESEESQLLVNPNLAQEEIKQLSDLSKEFHQAGSIWIASSGSAKQAQQSLKLVALKKSAMIAAAQAANEHLQSNGRKDVWIQALPRFHVGGLSIEIRAQLSGAKVVTGLREGQWDANYFVKKIQETSASLASLVPTQVHDLVQAKLQAPASLRAILVGGAMLSESLYFAAAIHGWPLLPSFGMTETCSQIATAELNSVKSKYPKLKVLKHLKVKTDEALRLSISGESLFSGFAQYHQGKSFWEPRKSGSWWTSEDFAELEIIDDKTYLLPIGREMDFIKINGEGIHLQRLREILQKQAEPQHLGQIEILARTHERKGQELVFIHSSSLNSQTAEKILKGYNQAVNSLEKIQVIIGISEIPRSPLGKVQWEELRRLSLRI